MMSALLTGVNRAYPYAKDSVDKTKMDEQMNTLYRVVHIVSFNTSVQALMLLYQVMDSDDSYSDRYYTSLYKKLIDPGLRLSSKPAIFLNLLYKSMVKDVSEKRIKAFLKRLLQVCAYHTPTFICGALVLLTEVLKARPGIVNIEQIGEEDLDDEEKFTDIKGDDSDEDASSAASDSDDDDDDVKPVKGSWVHRKNIGSDGKEVSDDYDVHHRNPLYCNADKAISWELVKLLSHFHPSVSVFAQKVLKGEPADYSGDPLQDFTLIRFLDRFVYRNPKKKDGKGEGAIMSKQRRYAPQGIKNIPVNSEEYLEQSEDKIPADERFLYKYFSVKAKLKPKKKELEDDNESVSSVSDDEFDTFLDGFEQQYGGEDVDFGLDFASEFKKGQSTKGKKKKSADESDDDDDIDEESDEEEYDEDGELSDEEMDFGDADFGGAFDSDMDEDEDADDDDDDGEDDDEELDEEDIEFSDNDGLGELDFSKPKKGKKRGASEMITLPSKKSKTKTGKGNMVGLFASADEFSHMVEDEAGLDVGGTEDMSNVKDKASIKQLKWEADRDKWVRGADWKSKKRQKPKMKGNPKKGPPHKGYKKQQSSNRKRR